MSSGVGRRRSSDLALLWLWCRPAATALIQPQAWESPHATGAALKRQKKKKKKEHCYIGFPLYRYSRCKLFQEQQSANYSPSVTALSPVSMNKVL